MARNIEARLTFVDGYSGGRDLEDTGEESSSTHGCCNFRERRTSDSLKLYCQLSEIYRCGLTHSDNVALLVCLFGVEKSVDK